MRYLIAVFLFVVTCAYLANSITIYTFGDRVQIQKKDTVDQIADGLKQDVQTKIGEKYGRKKWDPRIYRVSKQNKNVIWIKIKVDHKSFVGIVVEDAYSDSPNIIDCQTGDRNLGMKTGVLILSPNNGTVEETTLTY